MKMLKVYNNNNNDDRQQTYCGQEELIWAIGSGEVNKDYAIISMCFLLIIQVNF